MVEYLILATSLFSLVVSGLGVYILRKEQSMLLSKCEAQLTSAATDLKARGEKLSKAIIRVICSVCGRKVWQFDEYADGTFICSDCKAKGAKKA